MTVEIKKIPYMQWMIVPPDCFCLQNVLCTIETEEGERYVSFSHVGREKDMTNRNVIAYMIIPHMYAERTIWKSPHNGDNWPEKSGKYIVCLDCKAGHDETLQIRELWFDKKTQKSIEIQRRLPLLKV